MHGAAQGGSEVVTQALLAGMEKVCLDTPDSDDVTPLLCAARNKQKAVVRLFLATEGLNPAHKDSKGRTTLWWEVVHGHEDVVTELLAMKMVDPDTPGPDRQTPLLYAAEHGQETIVKLFLATNRVNHEARGSNQGTPFVVGGVQWI
jgi:ankyrin repeat protein